MSNRSTGRAERKPATVPLVPRPVPELGSLVNNLIERREDVVSELNLRNRSPSHRSISNSKPGNALLAERCVEDTLIPKLLAQANRTPEDSTECHVLSECYLNDG